MYEFITPQKRYYTLDFYLKKTYNSKVFKVSLNGDFTCPNRDGTISNHGCIFVRKKEVEILQEREIHHSRTI